MSTYVNWKFKSPELFKKFEDIEREIEQESIEYKKNGERAEVIATDLVAKHLGSSNWKVIHEF